MRLFQGKTIDRTSDRGMLITILALAWPTMLEQFMQTAVQYIDTAMVGTLGTQATAAKRAVAQAVLLTCVLGVFFTVLTVALSGMILWKSVIC
ncbi:MAG: hypothetical protein K2L82_11680 [Lachnospiraceae bacterium]|nr:hypothetical protein [Lachnospiraceae bacterium]